MGKEALPPSGSAAAAQFRNRIEPINGLFFTATAANYAANSAYLMRFRLGETFTVTNVEIRIGGTTAGQVDVGLFTSPDETTWTRVASSGPVSAGSANVIQTIPLTTPYTIPGGVDYWFAIGLTDASLMLLRTLTVADISLAGNKLIHKTSAWSTGLPASITSPTGGFTSAPWFALK